MVARWFKTDPLLINSLSLSLSLSVSSSLARSLRVHARDDWETWKLIGFITAAPAVVVVVIVVCQFGRFTTGQCHTCNQRCRLFPELHMIPITWYLNIFIDRVKFTNCWTWQQQQQCSSAPPLYSCVSLLCVFNIIIIIDIYYILLCLKPGRTSSSVCEALWLKNKEKLQSIMVKTINKSKGSWEVFTCSDNDGLFLQQQHIWWNKLQTKEK